MTGLLLLIVAAVWLWVVIWFANKIGRLLPKKWWGLAAKLSVAALLLPLPLIDEIVGGMQFAELCKQHDVIQVDRERAKGKTVYLLDQPSTWIENLAVPVRLQKTTFVDVTTREPVLNYVMVYAEGGKLIHALKISEGDEPMTFKSTCVPNKHLDLFRLFKELNITEVQRSTIEKGEKK